MPYAEGRTFYDADSHVMELPELAGVVRRPGVPRPHPAVLARRHRSRRRCREDDRARRASRRRSGGASGARGRSCSRGRAGTPTARSTPRTARARSICSASARSSSSRRSRRARSSSRSDVDVSYAASRALTRAMVEFCAVDPRLLPVTFVPLDGARARRSPETRFALDAGVKRHHDLADPAGDATRSRTRRSIRSTRCARSAACRSCSTSRTTRRARSRRGFAQNGWEGQTDFHGGGENFTGLLYMAVSHWVEVALAALVFDQVLERFPRAQDRRDRARRRLGAGVARAHRDRRRTRSAARRAACATCRCGRPTTCAARCASRRIRRRTSGASSSGAGRSCSCSRRTIRTSRAGGIR